jgi:hypothetical protein
MQAKTPAHRSMLEQTLAALDQQLRDARKASGSGL